MSFLNIKISFFHQRSRRQKHVALINVREFDAFAELGKIAFAQPQHAQPNIFQFLRRCFPTERDRPPAFLVENLFYEIMLRGGKMFADLLDNRRRQSNRLRFAGRQIERLLGFSEFILSIAQSLTNETNSLFVFEC